MATKIVNEEGEQVGVELVAKEIEAINKFVNKIENTRATRKMIVALIHDDTKLTKGNIELVLDSLRNLDRRYLKAGRKQ